MSQSSSLHTSNANVHQRQIIPSSRRTQPNSNAFPVRKIALKFCYSGSEYSGLAYQDGPTPLPTVEGVLFSAMAQTFLVNRDGGLEGCGWERCGRTDRGVSAAGQVVSVWVRTSLGKTHGVLPPSGVASETQSIGVQKNDDHTCGQDPPPSDLGLLGDLAFQVAEDFLDDEDRPSNPTPSTSHTTELSYITMINRVLPSTIRVLAWSPVAPDFSARFACKYRHYKYFFTPDDLDIPGMRDAASRLVGEHDFRNLCKLDVAKQITQFKRRILRAEIAPVNLPNLPHGTSTDNAIYVLDLVGTAFLYHQVRHIMAILFLVGAGLEHPSVVSALLNVSADHPETPQDGDPPLPIVDSKPVYQMADGLPLVLWDCVYDESDVHWRTDDVAGNQECSSIAGVEIYRQLHSSYTRSLISNTLDAHFLAIAARYHSPPSSSLSRDGPSPLGNISMPYRTFPRDVPYIPLGGGTVRREPKYVQLLERNRLEAVGVANERWRLGKGQRKLERQQAGRASIPDTVDGNE